uniref:Serine/threonine-protein phosphatase n=1 Tax=Proboscia inermis TaxID=420281 RepID=A0A7S0CDE3_9STRA|mmetsp:Transcript_39924/g.40561  ORF Transcript_39924/g.40561 Transcript_39924/m.40561 type:complete len:546 (+) Transcript_39924:265-1902(+)|eukprot:CAMPEP_0171296320 /NCGR_PEP_ID=MMETSP0816-20121228/4976_1 /TAXON_ID=420281 /ORGANISM="Proboscia inermis, Strain CCAP1064/1" /LENGTH=545 /DNA_ID=CAMNT_0011769661 /DNA_START=284 /DNA_END=1921 /DNA_ORIENTATION=-
MDPIEKVDDAKLAETEETESSTSSSTVDIDPETTASGVDDVSSIANGNTPTDDDTKKSVDLKALGNDALKESHFTQAVEHYTQALVYTPNSAVLFSNRAMAYIKMESFGLAISDGDAATGADPTYAKGFYRRGSAYFALNKYKAARKDFRAVCKLAPRSKDARTKLATCERAVRQAAFAAAIISEDAKPLSETMDPGTMYGNDSGYDGPHPSGGSLSGDPDAEICLFQPGSLPLEFVKAAIQHFKDQKLIHKRYVARLLVTCKKYFETLPSLLKISIPTKGDKKHITVCGDTHGQYYDVLNIFELNGLPSADNPYLFNGDFVDRGSFSVEVVLTYFLLKIACPDGIHLLRGNHETKNMNKIYGFEGEVKHKYDENIFNLFLEVFGHLPLAATINGKVFVAHGGIPTDATVMLEDVNKIKRGCEPPESGLMSDLLWSDPQPFPGKSPSKRGVGFAFGPDITEEFLSRNNLSLLIRSHEVKDEGYLVEHNGKTITIFSAPNYCDSMGNKGAFIHLDETMVPKFTKFEAVQHPEIRPMAYAAGMSGMF